MIPICNDNKISINKDNKLYFFYYPVIETSNDKLYQLICFVYATNKPKIIWKTIDTIIINDFKYKIILDELNDNKYICTLEIIKVLNKKDKEISCVIKNEDGTIYSTFSFQFLGHFRPINKLHGDLCIHNNFKKISFQHYFVAHKLGVVEFYYNQVEEQNGTWSSEHFLENISSNWYVNCMTVKFTSQPKKTYSFLSIVRDSNYQIIGTKYFIVIPKNGTPILVKSFQTLSTRSDFFEVNLNVIYTSESYPSVKWYGKRGKLIVAGKKSTILNYKGVRVNEYETILKIRSSFGSENNIYYCLVQNLAGFFSVSFTCNY